LKGGFHLDNANIDNDNSNDVFLFQHLVVMFQTLALQQLGKLMNPITGEMERDLLQAKITIDMLDMLQRKTTGNLEEDEKKIIDTVLMELRMNYVDETNRGKTDETKDNGTEAEEKEV
jgi:hypothetical protein